MDCFFDTWVYARSNNIVVQTSIMSNPKAVVLLSGGLDSTTTLAIAQEQGFSCYALTIDYGQRHQHEIQAASTIATTYQVTKHHIFPLVLDTIADSALTKDSIAVPKSRTEEEIHRQGDIPATYVPARNLIFLSLAVSWAETLHADAIFIGINTLDASGYPDCSQDFLDTFIQTANQATSVAANKRAPFVIHAPLIHWTKAQIIQKGAALGIDYGLTHSCYDPQQDGACGLCDACILRKKGFESSGIPNPTKYTQHPV